MQSIGIGPAAAAIGTLYVVVSGVLDAYVKSPATKNQDKVLSIKTKDWIEILYPAAAALGVLSLCLPHEVSRKAVETYGAVVLVFVFAISSYNNLSYGSVVRYVGAIAPIVLGYFLTREDEDGRQLFWKFAVLVVIFGFTGAFGSWLKAKEQRD